MKLDFYISRLPICLSKSAIVELFWWGVKPIGAVFFSPRIIRVPIRQLRNYDLYIVLVKNNGRLSIVDTKYFMLPVVFHRTIFQKRLETETLA